MRRIGSILLIAVSLALLGAAPAYADHLRVPPAAPLWLVLGADAVLFAHIGGGTVGLFAGATALATRKGGKLHRLSGNVFVVAMLIMSGIGGVVAPFLHDRISTLAGFMTFYLIVSAWSTARRREGVGAIEKLGLAIALCGAGWVYYLSWLASQTPERTLDGSPPQAFWVFGFVMTIAALSDLKVVLRGGIAGAQRIARHVWRTCFGLAVASGSLFLGQMQVFPAWLQHTPVLYVLALAPLPFLIFWILRVRLSKKWRGPTRTVAAAA
ncbi:MAG: hypothetical protein QM759_05740 [Terricaulis sp.]